MGAMFEAGLKYTDLTGSKTTPPELTDSLSEFRKTMNTYFIESYIAFQNVLFVNARGDIAYSIRRFTDYQSNLFAGVLSETPLSHALTQNLNIHGL